MQLFVILIVLVLLLVVHFTTMYFLSENTYVTSNVDKKRYLLRSGKHKSQRHKNESADALAEINKRVTQLILYLKETYMNDVDKAYFIAKLSENYNSSVISEAAIDNRYTTYTVDKENIHVCLRTRDLNEKMYHIDVLMYIVLHELAHLCNYDRNGSPIIGHGKEFKRIFRFLVEEAIKRNVYTYIDFEKNPQEYCGIVINSNIL